MPLTKSTESISEAQFSYLTKLVTAAYIDPAERTQQLLAMAGMNKAQASAKIDALKPQAAAAAQATKPTYKTWTTAEIVPGWYLIDGAKYKVKKAKYSEKVYLYGEYGEWFKGAKGEEICAKIAAEGKALAIAYAKVTGKCGVCNTKLTDPKSIAAGIGPVCAGKY